MTLYAEESVDPAILMLCQTHVIDVGGRSIESCSTCSFRCFRHCDRMLPETEVIDTIRRLGNSKERLAVGSLYTNHQHILVAPLDCSRVESGIDAYSLHEVWIGLWIEVVAPCQWCCLSFDDWVLPACIYAIALNWAILFCYKCLMLSFNKGFSFFECHFFII